MAFPDNKKIMESAVGLHLRLCPSLEGAVEKAIRLQQPLLQCFFMQQSSKTPLRLSSHEIKTFVRDYRSLFSQLFLHGSYLINLSGIQPRHPALMCELALAKRLFFTHMIVHPGSAKGWGTKEAGIDQLARALNGLLAQEQDITFVLENIAQAGMTIGGDLYDFRQLLEKIDYPEKLAFCIDTAHAHSYGYDLVTLAGQDSFVRIVAQTIGWEHVALVHLNDTQQECASHKDQHCALGQGVVGSLALRTLVSRAELRQKPFILELPEMSEEQELAALSLVRDWRRDVDSALTPPGALVPRSQEAP